MKDARLFLDPDLSMPMCAKVSHTAVTFSCSHPPNTIGKIHQRHFPRFSNATNLIIGVQFSDIC